MMQSTEILSPARREFLLGLYREFQQRGAPSPDERNELRKNRETVRWLLRGLADALSSQAITLEDFRRSSEQLAHQYPYYGFQGINGQMFVNQLAYAGRDAMMDEEVAQVLGSAFVLPADVAAARAAVDRVVGLVERLKELVKKYGALGPWRVPYLLSYFWEAGDLDAFPVVYPSTWRALESLGLVGRWPPTPGAAYEVATLILHELRAALEAPTWDIERFLGWVAEQGFVGIDPGDFERLAQNALINQNYATGQGYFNPEEVIEAKENIDAVIKRLKALQLALKPHVIGLFRGDVRTPVAGAKSSWGDSGQYRDEAWASFNSRADYGWGPCLRVGLTPEHFYWGFSLGAETKEARAAWERAPESFSSAQAAGARAYLFPLDGEPSELDSPTVPTGVQHHGVLIGWLADKDDPLLRTQALVDRTARDLAYFRPAVESVLEAEAPSPPVPPTTDATDRWEELARSTYSDPALLVEIQQLLNERRQVIFYGPPGTGKTYVAKRFAETFAGERDRVAVVQFHPSYSYEEFVEGLRPKSKDGQLTYEVEPGLLRRFAATARNDADNSYLLIIDEINRANLSKVFGELFYLLEYRDDAVDLPYSREKFSLPGNLYVIGTMNTSDRSIALVDFALRRRFGFVAFYPDDSLSQLRRYLADYEKQEYVYVADMLAEVNRAIVDRDFRLGHSYFMLTDPEQLNEERIERTWRYSIEPYLREYWYDRDASQLEDYTFERLRARVEARARAETAPPEAPAEPGPSAEPA